MTETTERPVPRRRARPAADEDADPMDTGHVPQPPPSDREPAEPHATVDRAVGTSSAVPELPPGRSLPPARQESKATVTLNVRVSPQVDAVVASVIAATGQSKRAVVEYALLHTYG
jgi:hypothetical protein